MARDRTLKKVGKMLKRVEKHIEDTKEALEDLEIEFEVLKATIKRLEKDQPVDEVIEEELDLENSTNMQKF
jgi:ferritin-like metal-binding protein YciE